MPPSVVGCRSAAPSHFTWTLAKMSGNISASVVDGIASLATEEDEKMSLGHIGYAFKLAFCRLIALSSPKIVPGSHAPIASKSNKKSRRQKVYATLVPSSEGLCLSNDCKEVLIPFDGNLISLEHCRRVLFANWTMHAKTLMNACNRQDAPLRIFELSSLNLKLVCCPDPRPTSWLHASSQIRVTHELAEDDNQIASHLLMAECGWDLTQVMDIFGPILVFSLNGDNLKSRHLKTFIDSYFGDTNLEDFLEQADSTVDSTAESLDVFSLPEYVVEAARLQAKGAVPATDLLTHFDGSGKKNESLLGVLSCKGCGSQGSKESPLRACTRCEMAFYCSHACQKSHYATHRVLCKKAGDIMTDVIS